MSSRKTSSLASSGLTARASGPRVRRDAADARRVLNTIKQVKDSTYRIKKSGPGGGYLTHRTLHYSGYKLLREGELQKAENQGLRKFFDNELRFDYTRHPSKSGKQFVIHVPSTFREEMARKISHEIVRWLGNIASGKLCRFWSYKAEAMRIASEITPTLATRVRFDEPYDDQLQPDLSFTYGSCAVAGLVVEIAWSQSNLNLAERAMQYIEGQKGAIRTVVGLNMNDIYHGGCLATFSVWKAKWNGDTWRCTTVVDNKEFLDEKGQVVNRCYLSLSLQDFVCEKKAGKFKEFEDVLLEIPSTKLYTLYKSALKRHVMGEAMEEIEKLKRKVHDSPDKLLSVEKSM